MYLCFSIVLKSHFIRFFSVMFCVTSVSPVTLILHVFCFTNINIICELVGSDNSSTTTTPYILLTTHKQTTPNPQNNCNCVCPTYSAVENCPSSITQSKQLTYLTFSTLGKIFSRGHIETCFSVFPENRVWHFMQIVFNGLETICTTCKNLL